MTKAKNKYQNGYFYIRGQKIIPPRERLINLMKINPQSKCWEWQGALKGKAKLKQYGNLIVGSRTDKTRRSVSAHRYSYEVFIGPIPEGLWVLHSCDNPKCINPKHLFLGTRQDNTGDRENKGRNRMPNLKGENHGRAKLTLKQVQEIRSYRGFLTQQKIADKFGVSRETVSGILLGRTWKIIPPPPKELKHGK